jgi:lipid-binding SYLF domain-containing protein
MNLSRSIGRWLIPFLLLSGCQTFRDQPGHTTQASVDAKARVALRNLYATMPAARLLSRDAQAILVFPGVLKAGFIGGAQYGTGALIQRGKTMGYYTLVAGSYGLQAGVQSFDYAMFFMKERALNYLDQSNGWEVGVGPSVVVVDTGVTKSLTTTTGRSDVYAFISGQQGLMGGLGIQGSKITRITLEH